ncbi:hypothetical protein IV203_037088 [Nitzschia inconspicua]|uniref:Uncharacterized protein n=1 Tax=Nitzschia inconspicua TaxID=303405 RepID=A0A9K3LKU7_9STRA|nr:hypothetical protein IV203_037088 [Nitzschia inconspicua]
MPAQHFLRCMHPQLFLNWTVERSVYGISAESSSIFGPVFLHRVGSSSSFTAGATGSYLFSRDVDSNTDGTIDTVPLGGSCDFSFNDEECLCEQRYCDETQERYGYFINCSSIEGGAVIDFCQGLAGLSAESTDLEKLFQIPHYACNPAAVDDEPFQAATATFALPGTDPVSPVDEDAMTTTTNAPAADSSTGDGSPLSSASHHFNRSNSRSLLLWTLGSFASSWITCCMLF